MLDHTATVDQIGEHVRLYVDAYACGERVGADVLDCWLETVCVEVVNTVNEAAAAATGVVTRARSIGVPSLRFEREFTPIVALINRADSLTQLSRYIDAAAAHARTTERQARSVR